MFYPKPICCLDNLNVRRQYNVVTATSFLILFLCSSTRLSSALIHQAELDLQSCADFDVVAGDSLQEDCESHCFPQTHETFDYAEPSDDGETLIRNTVCRCFSDDIPDNGNDVPADGTQGQEEVDFNSATVDSNGRVKTFECWTEAEVWDLTTPIFPCGEVYNITSLSTCKAVCERIDPNAVTFSGVPGSIRCACAADVVVCDDTSAAGWSSRRRGVAFVSMVISVTSYFLATFL
jgi:hypothetical protein